jgi:hypothetical protein
MLSLIRESLIEERECELNFELNFKLLESRNPWLISVKTKHSYDALTIAYLPKLSWVAFIVVQ